MVVRVGGNCGGVGLMAVGMLLLLLLLLPPPISSAVGITLRRTACVYVRAWYFCLG